jgi:hypothetical protein
MEIAMTMLTQNPEMHGTTKQSKVDRYKWKVVDEPGQFLAIHKDELHIDLSYQRAANNDKIRKIAGKWSWIACGAIIVGCREGRYYVIDGGHRVMASRHRIDIKTLPCLVFSTADNIEEATGFLNANTQRKPMTAFDKFKALVITGDETAVAVQKIAEDSGYELSGSAGTGSSFKVKCVGALMINYRLCPEAYRNVWPILGELYGGKSMHEKVVSGLFHLEMCSLKNDISIARPPWRQRVLKLGAEQLVNAASKAAAYYCRGGNRVWAKGIMDLLNHGARNRLDVIGDGKPLNQAESEDES